MNLKFRLLYSKRKVLFRAKKIRMSPKWLFHQGILSSLDFNKKKYSIHLVVLVNKFVFQKIFYHDFCIYIVTSNQLIFVFVINQYNKPKLSNYELKNKNKTKIVKLLFIFFAVHTCPEALIQLSELIKRSVTKYLLQFIYIF